MSPPLLLHNMINFDLMHCWDIFGFTIMQCNLVLDSSLFTVFLKVWRCYSKFTETWHTSNGQLMVFLKWNCWNCANLIEEKTRFQGYLILISYKVYISENFILSYTFIKKRLYLKFTIFQVLLESCTIFTKIIIISLP